MWRDPERRREMVLQFLHFAGIAFVPRDLRALLVIYGTMIVLYIVGMLHDAGYWP